MLELDFDSFCDWYLQYHELTSLAYPLNVEPLLPIHPRQP
jgi:hypothetical protein